MDSKDNRVNHLAADTLFIKRVKGDKDPKNVQYWESLLRRHPEMKGEAEEATAIINSFLADLVSISEEEINSMQNTLLTQTRLEQTHLEQTHLEQTRLAQIHLGKETSSQRAGGVMRCPQAWGWLKRAAAVALPMALLTAYLFSVRKPVANTIVETPDVLTQEVKFNLKGNKSMIRLTDGTKVWLNVNSQLECGEHFNTGNTREVSLKGEGYFEVFPNAKKPFIVHASDIAIKVLGTAFNLKSYAGEPTIETTVIHGKVGINKQGAEESLILRPNQRAVFKKDTKAINVEQVTVENITEWKEDRLVFEETPISEVLSKIEAYYNVKVRLKKGDKLDCTLTGEIGQEGIEEIFKLLEATYAIRYRISGRDIYVDDYFCKN